MYVCMYDVVAAAVAVNMVIVLLLGGTSCRVCVVGRVGRRVCGCGWVCGCVGVWGESERKDREEKKEKKRKEKKGRIRVCGRGNKP